MVSSDVAGPPESIQYPTSRLESRGGGPESPSLDSMTVARTIVEALVEGGVHEAVIAPGSRSAPLVYALSEAERADRLRLHVRNDERSAAFTALGLSLASGRPAAVVTTSGTATGNMLPAIMEADHAGVQLVALTADRPEEMQGTGANQTTAQHDLYHLHVRYGETLSGDSPEPISREQIPDWLAEEAAQVSGADVDPRFQALRQQRTSLTSAVSRALLAAQGFNTEEVEGFAGMPGVNVRESAQGPVHLNVRLRAPLVPSAQEAPDAGSAPFSAARENTGASAAPGAVAPQAVAPVGAPGVPPQLPGAGAVGTADLEELLEMDVSGLNESRTVVVAGHGAGPVAAAFANALGLPLLAEPSSNARFGPNAVAAYPLLLGSAGGLGEDSHPVAAQIEQVILFGRPTLTRQVTALLRREDLHTALYLPEPVAWFEPGRRRERPVEELEELAVVSGRGPGGWLAAWQSAGTRAQSALEEALSARHDAVGHPGAMRTGQLVAATVRGPMVLGSSSVVRDVDLSWRPPTTPHSLVFANRGLSGTDGNVSTATGVALGTGRRTVLLCGDLTLLHDVGGLQLGAGEQEPDLDIVVVNDRGGSIFAALEHGEVATRPGMGDVVERFFGTPQDVEVRALCAAYGLGWAPIESEESLIAALGDPVRGRRVLELRSDREARPGVRRAVEDAVRATY